MRHTFLVMTAFIGCGILAGAAAQSAVAAPLSQIAANAAGASLVETVGYWKRYCRYNDWTGTNVVVVPTPAVPAVPAAPVVVPGSPTVIAVVPVRPVSCGEFRYWNGTACVDARYNTPYIGPR
jgi:hypothetical protein